MFKNSPLFIIGLLSFCSFLSSCKSKSASNETEQVQVTGDLKPVKNDWFVGVLPANPSTLNPVLASDAYARAITGPVFDTLISFNVETGEPEGQLATSWTISPDGLQYDFEIRQDAKFHDGKPVTIEDVKFSYDVLKDPKVNAAHLQNYFKNFQRAEILSPTKIRFHLSEVYFRNLIMLGLVEIFPKHIYGKGDFNTNPANRAPVGSGPYKFSKWDSGRELEMLQFEDYWGNNDPRFKDRNNFLKIIYKIIPEDAVSTLALKKGDIDALDPTPDQYFRDLKGPEIEKNFYRLSYTTEDGNGYRFIGWNLNRPLFQSKNIRQALAMAMPRESLSQTLFEGQVKLAVGPFPQVSSKTDPSLKPFPYDLAKALELLEAEGWKDSDGDGILDKNKQKLSFELLFVSQAPDIERIAVTYQESLKRLGVDLKLKTLEWTVFLKNVQERKFDGMMMAWGSSLDSDPYQIFHSSQSLDGGSNRVSYKNERVDEILTQARTILDREKRNELYREFSRIVADDAPYLFLFERPSLAIVTRRFEGVLPVGKLGLDSTRYFTPMGREKYPVAASK
jgi:peptide/nickel transport system substrate-binding protein